jgi:hypothetical protein
MIRWRQTLIPAAGGNIISGQFEFLKARTFQLKGMFSSARDMLFDAKHVGRRKLRWVQKAVVCNGRRTFQDVKIRVDKIQSALFSPTRNFGTVGVCSILSDA